MRRKLKVGPPPIGKWVSCDDHFPPTGVTVLGWFGGMDIEAVQCMCRNDGKREEDWWWQTRCGDTAQPRAWAEVEWDLLHALEADDD